MKPALSKALRRLASRNSVKDTPTGVHDCMTAADLIEKTIQSLGEDFPIENSAAYRAGLRTYFKYAEQEYDNRPILHLKGR